MEADGSMEGMDMVACKISMLWNTYTIDACFLSPHWRIRSGAAFAGLCLGIIAMVVLLEFLKRVGKSYDRHLIRSHRQKVVAMAIPSPDGHAHARRHASGEGDVAEGPLIAGDGHTISPLDPFRPNIFEQATRAAIHTLQFTVAYFIMLMAMYYNAYILLCIVIGAFIGYYLFEWERLGGHEQQPGAAVAGGASQMSDPTGCCA